MKLCNLSLKSSFSMHKFVKLKSEIRYVLFFLFRCLKFWPLFLLDTGFPEFFAFENVHNFSLSQTLLPINPTRQNYSKVKLRRQNLYTLIEENLVLNLFYIRKLLLNLFVTMSWLSADDLLGQMFLTKCK